MTRRRIAVAFATLVLAAVTFVGGLLGFE